MKKNISINISGIIFHIEEDGYERLKEYLESINKYFSTFDGSTEIIADIESRIAEIFLAKLNEDRQVITLDDVTGLIATMGGIQDFQAVEEEISSPTTSDTEEEQEEEYQEESAKASPHEPKKKLYRDKNRQLIGGVASGIAHYFSIDPLWIRLIFIVFLFDVFLTFSLSALVLIVYIVLWIVVPESTTLKEDKKLKKIYRNPQGRVIGGVGSGVAAYFDIDVALVRVLFVLATFLGGSGLIVYVVLWIILPEAKSITDKVQMKGEPVTLENIESNIKSTEEAKANPKEESTIVKILLFPFRLIAIILTGLSKALGPMLNFIIQFIRVILGVVITLIGISLLFSVLITASVFLGIMAGSSIVHLGVFPVELINQIVSPVGFIAAMIVVGIPALAIMFLGISVAAKTRIPNATVGWAMFGIWLVGMIGLSFTLPNILKEFRTEGEFTQTTFYNVNESQLVLDINENGYDEYPDVRVKLRGYDGTEVKLVQEFSARGASKLEANKNAREIRYSITQEDSVLIFDSNIDFGSAPYFRNQDLFMTMYIPYGKTFVMKNEFDDIIYYSFGYQGYRSSQIIDNTWMFNPTGLECLTCADYTSSREKRREDYQTLYEENLKVTRKDKNFDLTDFNELKISGSYKVNIVRGDSYRVVLSGLGQNMEKTTVSQEGNNISIKYENDEDLDIHRYNRKITVKIICPNLRDLRLLGSISGDVSGFEEDEMYIKLDGASEINLDADIYALDVKLSGAAELNITGTGKDLNVNISTASFLNTYNYLAENVTLKASGAAKARVYASEELKIEASLISEVKYRGGAKVTTVKSSAFSKVRED